MKEEIRTFNGVDYKVIKTPCKCPCHIPGARVMHVRACCNNGFVERLQKIEKNDDTK
jgi:hypothetical protein